MEEFSSLTENLKDVIVYSTAEDVNTQRKNRGFCFLHFDSHIDAANARKKIGRRGVRVFNSEIYVDWADPIDDNEEVNLADVKILYVRNLSSDVTEEQVREKFGAHGTVEKVKRMKDYAFVHFEEREHALKAMEAMNGFQGMGKCTLEVSLARPVSEKVKQKREQRKLEHQKWPGSGGGGGGGGAGSLGAGSSSIGVASGGAGGFYGARGAAGAQPFRPRGGRWGGGGGGGGIWGAAAATNTWSGYSAGGWGNWGSQRTPAVGSFRGAAAPRYGAAAVPAVAGAGGGSFFGAGGFRGGARGGAGFGATAAAGSGGFYNRPFNNGANQRGGRGFGPSFGAGGFGGGGGFSRGGGFAGGFARGTKRKAQDGGAAAGPAGDVKRDRRDNPGSARAADQDWTSDVTGNW